MSSVTCETDPEALIASYEARAERIDTPCGEGTMAWRIWGEGQPVVLGHGAQGSWLHWIRNIDALVAAGFRVIAADMPGHGDSAMPATPDHAGIAEAIAAGLRQVLAGQLPADLVGFSFGGTAFSYTAAWHPDVARRVILVGCGGLDTPLGHVDLRRAKGLEGAERREALTLNLLGLMLHARESVDELALHQMVATARKARLDVPGLVLPDRLLHILPEVKVPVDAIWGEFDRPHPDPEVQEQVLRRIQPGTDFRVIAGAGHWAMYERPGAFDAALIDMLRQPPRSL